MKENLRKIPTKKVRVIAIEYRIISKLMTVTVQSVYIVRTSKGTKANSVHTLTYLPDIEAVPNLV